VSNPAVLRSSTGGTPKQKMPDTQEIVTAILGITIVAFTLTLTGIAFSMAGEGTRMRDAITVLTLLFGLAGVVVGYYFGRIPAEKRANTATEAMNIASTAMDAANHDKRAIITKAAEIHNGMEDNMDKARLTPSMLPDLTKESLTEEQWDYIKAILASVHEGISGITLPPAERSN
jgi:hypothetical protein